MSNAGSDPGLEGPLTWQEYEQAQRESVLPEMGADPLLRMFVRMANDQGLSFGITLSVGGLLLSGVLVSKRDWMKQFSEKWVSGIDDDEAKSQWDEAWRRLWHEDHERDEDDKPEPFYRSPSVLHLNDARVFHPGGDPIPSQQNVQWSVRLTQVDAWSLGTLSSG